MEGGVLGIVLLISRVVGVAPFLRGAKYRISLSLVILAKLFILITAIYFVVISASYSNLFHQTYESLIIFDILRTTSHIFVIVTTLVSVFNSPERTIKLLQFNKQLDQIDKKILGDNVQYGNDIKLTVLIFIYLHVCLVLRAHSLNIEQINETICRFLFLINHYMITLSALQVGLFARRTMFSLKVINSSLEKLSKISPSKDISSQITYIRLKPPILAWEKLKQQSCNIRPKQGRLVKTRLEHIEEPVKLIRQCLKNYLNVCDIITTSMDGDGFFIVILLMLNIIDLLTHSYNLAICVFVSGSNFNKPNVFTEIVWCIAYSLSVILFIESYHRIQSEMQKLQFLLMSLKSSTSLDEIDINNELHLFGRVISINKPNYSPLGMFTLNRLLVVKIFGSLVTYLVIMVTYGPKIDNLNLVTEYILIFLTQIECVSCVLCEVLYCAPYRLILI